MKFIAALDQSGGSTPSTLERYGIDEWMGDDGMMRRVHDMRLRIINSPSFTNKHISNFFYITYEEVADGSSTKPLQEEKVVRT